MLEFKLQIYLMQKQNQQNLDSFESIIKFYILLKQVTKNEVIELLNHILML